MKQVTFTLLFILSISTASAQTGRQIQGMLIDSSKTPLTGSSVRLKTEKGDSSTTIANAKGMFVFTGITGNKLTLTISSIGYQTLIRHYILDNNPAPALLGVITLKQQPNMLNQVNIVATNAVSIKEDTVEYKASAYKVRDNAPVEDLLRKMPGVDVDANGNVTAQGKAVTKVRVNGKDFFGGDVQSATRNLPADIVDNVQVIDDYGDQANLTGIKTGDPAKIMNINIRKDKNYGYTGQATLGDGSDALPANPGITNDNRYIGLANAFKFNGDQQIAFLGNINNTNVNTFSFGSPAMGPSSGSVLLNKKIAADAMMGGGGVKLTIGSGGNFTSQASQQNGITDAHAIGANFRDQWGKNLSVYGSYSFADNTIFTKTSTLQQNTSADNPGNTNQTNNQIDRNINHRFTWNMEYKPDTVNYFKITPNFSYANTISNGSGQVTSAHNNVMDGAYNSTTYGTLTSPNYGFTALYNHRFNSKGRDFSININLNSSHETQYQNPVFDYTTGTGTAPSNQMIITSSRSNNIGTTLSYLEPLGNFSYMEFNYTFSRSATSNDKKSDVLDTVQDVFKRDTALSNRYNYTFITNRFDLNYHYAQKGKYNYTLGLSVEPSELNGNSVLSGITTHVSAVNLTPTAHFVYNLSRSRSFNFNYSGSSSQPNFTQLQPVTDFTNALYPVTGNPNLKPSFTSNISARYNQFSFDTGNLLFTNLSYTQTQNQVVTNTIIYPAVYKPNAALENTYLTRYLNANGYYTASGYISYAKPWDNRRYTLMFNGTVAYTNNIGYITDIAPGTYTEAMNKNIAKNWTVAPGIRFRTDIPDVIDAQILTNYSVSKTDNSVHNEFTNASANIRTWNMGLSGKNYFHNWTVSYDYSKAINYGYAQSINVVNPNILNMYVERRLMKGNKATIRFAAFDLFNQNTGFSTTTTASSVIQTNNNRLGRYYLATFTLRLQKFAGR